MKTITKSCYVGLSTGGVILYLNKITFNLLLEFTVVDESPQLGLFDEIELLFEGELFIVKSW